jgi:hypothetical protein
VLDARPLAKRYIFSCKYTKFSVFYPIKKYMEEFTMFNKNMIIAVILISLSGCAKIPNVTPVENYAFLNGKGKNDFSLAIDFKNPLSKSTVEFVSLDTVYLGNYDSNPTSLNITPGVHTIVAKCMIFSSKYHLSPKHKYTSSKTINMHFNENAYYSFTGFVGDNKKCRIKVAKHESYDNFSIFSTKSSVKSYKKKYLSKNKNKAFAQSPAGFWAWSANKKTISDAEKSALKSCKSSNSREEGYPCKIIDINGHMVD